MASFALKRILVAVLVAFTVSVVSFTVLRLSADLAQALAGEGASSEQVEQIRISYGLDRPLALQYLDWLGNIIRGDLGESYYFKQPVSALILERVPVTFTVATLALGIGAALNRNSWLDRLCLTTAVVGQAVPSFWLALMLIYIFGLHWQWLPLSGSEEWQGFILPIIVLAYYAMPAIMRLTRAGMIEVLHADYIRTARAKGLSLRAIVTTHALRNALMPVVALAAVQFGFLLGGSTVVETVFALHGVGYLSWESIQRADFPVVQSIVLMFSMIFVVLTLASDLLNAAIDPRVRLQ